MQILQYMILCPLLVCIINIYAYLNAYTCFNDCFDDLRYVAAGRDSNTQLSTSGPPS